MHILSLSLSMCYLLYYHHITEEDPILTSRIIIVDMFSTYERYSVSFKVWHIKNLKKSTRKQEYKN